MQSSRYAEKIKFPICCLSSQTITVKAKESIAKLRRGVNQYNLPYQLAICQKRGHVIHPNSSKSLTKCTYVGPSLYHVLLRYYLYQASKNIYGQSMSRGKHSLAQNVLWQLWHGLYSYGVITICASGQLCFHDSTTVRF